MNTGSSGIITLYAGTSGPGMYLTGNTVSISTTNTPGVDGLKLLGGNVNIVANATIGSPGTTTNFGSNVNYNGTGYTATFYGNLITGTTSSQATFRGTNMFQGNVKFDAPYYETVNAMGNQSGTLTINTGICNTFTITLIGDATLNTTSFTNMITGKSVTLILTQDATGSRLLTSDLKFAGASKTLSTAAGAIDVINVYYDGVNYLASLVKGYA